MSANPYGQPTEGYGQPQQPVYGQPQPASYGQPVQASPYAASPAAGYAAPAAAYGAAPYAYAPAPKSKTVAALLAFFFGGIGVHNFYRGQKTQGFIHIALAVLAFLIFIISTVAGVASVDTVTGDISDAGAGGMVIGMGLGYLISFANGIWAFVEFIMILMSKDGSLQ